MADEDNGNTHYRIGAVARITGVPAHTIRIWERRYGLLAPTRTPGGTRVYAEADIHRLKTVNELVEQGHAIGSIAHLSTDDLRAVLQRHHPPKQASARPQNGMQSMQDTFLAAVEALRMEDAEELLGRAVATLPPRVLIYEFVAPLMQQVGERWEQGTLRVAHEHAVSAMVRGQIAPLMHRLGQERGHAVASTPSGEWHEFGALLATLVAVLCGWRVSYLGPNLPAEEIAYAAEESQASLVLLSCVSLEAAAVAQQVRALREKLSPSIGIVVGGRGAATLSPAGRGISVEQSLQALEARLSQG